MSNKGKWLPTAGDPDTGGFQTGTQNGNIRSAHVHIANPGDLPGGGGSTPTLTLRLDEPDKITTYIGQAAIGSASNAAAWRIYRLVESGDETIQTWADGNSDFDNIWDNRASLTYS